MGDIFGPTVVPGSEILRTDLRPDRDYKVKPYDFRRPDKFSKEQIITLKVLHDGVGRLCSPILAGVAGQPVEMRCVAVDQLTYGEFFASFPSISALIPVSMSPLRGAMIMQMDGSLAQLLVRAACGSKPATTMKQPSRAPTEIERLVLRDILESVTPLLDAAWSNVTDLRSEVVSIETDPQLAQIVPPGEMIVLASMEVSVAGDTAFVNFAIPYITIEPIIGKLSAQYWYSTVRRDAAPTGWHRVMDLPVEMEVYAEAMPISLADLPAVVAGKPIELPTLSSGTLTIDAGGTRVATAAVRFADLEMDAALTVRVMERNPATGLPDAASTDPAEVALVSAVGPAMATLTGQIRELHHAVLEIRDDRESLLAGVADPITAGHGELPGSETDHRYHRDISNALAAEDPATIAFVLAGLPPVTAAAVLADIEPDMQPTVVRAIVSLGDADRRLHKKLLAYLGRRFTRSLEMSTPGGVEAAVEILNNVPRSTEIHVMETFHAEDKSYFEEIAKRMFVFEDFMLLDSLAIRKVVERSSAEEFALAMKGVPAEVHDHIMAALDEGTAELISDAIRALGPARRRDVEAAQREMIEELRELDQAGEVVVARPDEVIE